MTEKLKVELIRLVLYKNIMSCFNFVENMNILSSLWDIHSPINSQQK